MKRRTFMKSLAAALGLVTVRAVLPKEPLERLVARDDTAGRIRFTGNPAGGADWTDRSGMAYNEAWDLASGGEYEMTVEDAVAYANGLNQDAWVIFMDGERSTWRFSNGTTVYFRGNLGKVDSDRLAAYFSHG